MCLHTPAPAQYIYYLGLASYIGLHYCKVQLDWMSGARIKRFKVFKYFFLFFERQDLMVFRSQVAHVVMILELSAIIKFKVKQSPIKNLMSAICVLRRVIIFVT